MCAVEVGPSGGISRGGGTYREEEVALAMIDKGWLLELLLLLRLRVLLLRLNLLLLLRLRPMTTPPRTEEEVGVPAMVLEPPTMVALAAGGTGMPLLACVRGELDGGPLPR